MVMLAIFYPAMSSPAVFMYFMSIFIKHNLTGSLGINSGLCYLIMTYEEKRVTL